MWGYLSLSKTPIWLGEKLIVHPWKSTPPICPCIIEQKNPLKFLPDMGYIESYPYFSRTTMFSFNAWGDTS
jgi:hypothetical protein